jgi:uncharacterized protein YjbI with pentapeptide repeats
MDTTELLKRYAAGDRDFQGAKLSYAYLLGEDLSEINLSGAIMWWINLSNTVLKEQI